MALYFDELSKGTPWRHLGERQLKFDTRPAVRAVGLGPDELEPEALVEMKSPAAGVIGAKGHDTHGARQLCMPAERRREERGTKASTTLARPNGQPTDLVARSVGNPEDDPTAQR